MKNRLKEIRKALKMSQADLANAIGYGRGHVGGLESGARTITERIQRTICEKLNVNPEWLETGRGEMFAPPTADDAAAAHQYLIRRIQGLPDDLKEEVIEFCVQLLSAEQYTVKKNEVADADHDADAQNLRKVG